MTPRLALLALLALPAVVAAEEKVPPHLAAARSLLEEVAPESTSYRHKEPAVRWAEPGKAAECHTDCSGLLNALFEKTRPGVDFPKWLGKRRPLAEHYHDAIEAGKGFRRVEKVADIRPGDVLAVRFPPGEENTGHVMLADAPPARREATKPVVAGTAQWELVIIDSTGHPHGPADSRRKEDGTPRTGLGRGTIRLYADEDGTLAGYAWSTSAASDYRASKDRPMVVGRPGD